MRPARSALDGMTAAAPPFVQVGAQPVVVEGIIADQRLKIEAGDQRLDADAVVPLAGQQDARFPRASTKAMILVVNPPRERPTA